MAVAFSTGGSGYPRSDFMISDAALPARVEEAAMADQTKQFSKVLSGIGGQTKNAVSDKMTDAQSGTTETTARLLSQEFKSEDGSVDVQKLVKAIAEGEISMEDLPQELLTSEVLGELVELVKQVNAETRDEKPAQEDDPNIQQAAAELAAFMTQTTVPDDIADMSVELSELAGKTVRQVEAVSVSAEPVQPEEQAVQPQDTFVQTENAEVQPEVVAEEAAVTDQAADIAAPAEEDPQPVKTAEQPQGEAKQEALPQEAVQTVQPAQNDGQQSGEGQFSRQGQSGQGGQQAAQTVQVGQQSQDVQAESVQQSAAVKQTVPVEDAKFTDEVEIVEVKTSPVPEEAPKHEQTQIFTPHEAQRSRVVSKSDELEMIRSGGEKTDDSQVQNMIQPQTMTPEKPVIFTRQDGTEVMVKPADVAQQVADRLVERAGQVEEGETEYTVTLNPEDLGSITVKMTKTADGAVSVSIAAENSRTLKMIEDNGSAIRDSLRQNGVQLENWQVVSESTQDMQAQDYRGSSKNPYRESEEDRQGEKDNDDADSFAEIIASM